MDEGWERILLTASFLLLAALSIGGVYILRAATGVEHPLMVVVSQSMIPTLGVGDLLIVGAIEDLEDLEAGPPPEGEIIVFIRPGNTEEFIVHRVVKKYKAGHKWFFVTKGDNNPNVDPSPIPEENVLGRVVGRIPILGYLPLFQKTRGGIILIAALMILIFFSDTLIPVKGEGGVEGGLLPKAALLPLLPALLIYLLPQQGFKLEVLALLSWYLGCILMPLAVEDDTGMILWLYHFVFIVTPIALDLVWRLFHITPSMWWYAQGSTVPLSLLLMRETPFYLEAFKYFLRLTMPGCLLFFATMTAKRRGLLPRRGAEDVEA
ncbi:MAG: S26B, signal peptidase I [Candidatus Bathyarchaeota archaeon B23]|nr:MAG: S26B, signal peptidase I [Candidatus Bathyarchaeota archaeon B23]